MTKPIRNTGPCFHLNLPRQRGQRDVLSHTEFINVHILHALSLPGHPLRVTRKPPTADWWVLLLALPEETIITINIVPCEVCPRDRDKVVGTLQGPEKLSASATCQYLKVIVEWQDCIIYVFSSISYIYR